MLRSAALCLLLGSAAPALADADDDRARAVFLAAFGEACAYMIGPDGQPAEPPQRFEAAMDWTGSDPEHVTLWQFRCDMGAYNVIDVFVLKTEIEGMLPVALPMPELKIEYEVPDDYESPVKELAIVGWSARHQVVNAAFDPVTVTLSGATRWRGLGDAYDASVWVLRDGGFRLVSFEADAAYDEQQEPQLTAVFE